MIVLTICLASLVIAMGVQVLARFVQRHGTDLRAAGPLVELRRTHVPTIQPADFDRLEGIVADGLLSDAHFDRHLFPLLVDLASRAPGGSYPLVRPGRRGRAFWLERTLTELESAWGIGG